MWVTELAPGDRREGAVRRALDLPAGTELDGL